MLNNKRILVAGAAGLLGSRVVAALLNAGAEVIATDLTEDLVAAKLEAVGVDCKASAVSIKGLNIVDENDVKVFFHENHGIVGAVNCTYPRNSSYGAHFYDVSMENFNENIGLHLGSAFLFMQQCAALFEKHGSAFSLVNIASIYGVVAPKFNIYEGTAMTVPVEYAAAKSAIVQLTKYVSSYVSDSKFRVNCISPGGILDNQPNSFLEAYKGNTNGTGMIGVDDINGAIIFLLSDTSKFITGQNIVVDDGFTNH